MARPKRTELPDFLNAKEFANPADKLIEAVNWYLTHQEGERFTRERLKELCIGVIEIRIDDGSVRRGVSH